MKDYLKSLWQQALRIPLQCLAVNASDVGAWKLLFLMPSMLLTRDVRQRGEKGSAEIKKKFRMFLDFSWQPLLKNPATPSYFNSGESLAIKDRRLSIQLNPLRRISTRMRTLATASMTRPLGVSEERGRLRKAERHVHEGALSRAARLLTSSGLAPDTDDTRQKLKKKASRSF